MRELIYKIMENAKYDKKWLALAVIVAILSLLTILFVSNIIGAFIGNILSGTHVFVGEIVSLEVSGNQTTYKIDNLNKSADKEWTHVVHPEELNGQKIVTSFKNKIFKYKNDNDEEMFKVGDVVKISAKVKKIKDIKIASDLDIENAIKQTVIGTLKSYKTKEVREFLIKKMVYELELDVKDTNVKDAKGKITIQLKPEEFNSFSLKTDQKYLLTKDRTWNIQEIN